MDIAALLIDLKARKKATLQVRNGQLSVYHPPSSNHLNSHTGYFTLKAKQKHTDTKDRFNNNNFTFYVCPGHLRVSVNGRVVRKESQKIGFHDVIQVQNLSFTLAQGIQATETNTIISVQELVIGYPGNNKPIVQRLSFSIQRGEFVALMGPSGCGKTTLLKELAGANNRIAGKIRIGDKNIDEYFHTDLKTRIGYVQQHDHLHPSLSVEETLYYAGKIKSTPGYQSRIKKILSDLNIPGHLLSKKISELSGGQQKRVAIAVELIDQPDILLLDEPTSPLDPQSIDIFLTSLRKLASVNNIAVIMVTHKPDDMEYADKVLFLATGGSRQYYGPSKNFIPAVLSKIRSEGGEITQLNTLLGIYAWYSDTANIKTFDPGTALPPSRYPMPLKGASYNSIRQWYWLFRRYVQIRFPSGTANKVRQKTIQNLLFQPLLISLLFFAFPNFNMTILFLISLAVIWLGVNNASKEIVEELPVYERERAFNVKVDPYLLSKIVLLMLMAIVQIIIILTVVWIKFHLFNHGRFPDIQLYDPVSSFCYLTVLSLAATVLGLLASTFHRKIEVVLMWVPVLLIPQIILSGLVSKPDTRYKEGISYAMIGRWGLEGLCRIQDSAAHHNKKVVTGGYTVASANSVAIESVYPEPFDTLVYAENAAMYVLGSYNDHVRKDNTKAWTIFHDLRGNYIVLGIHILLLYFICRLQLMRMDPIPVNRRMTKKNIQYILRATGGLMLLLFIISMATKKTGPITFNLPDKEPVKKDSSRPRSFRLPVKKH